MFLLHFFSSRFADRGLGESFFIYFPPRLFFPVIPATFEHPQNSFLILALYYSRPGVVLQGCLGILVAELLGHQMAGSPGLL